jgi:hypothetical protein
MSETLRETIQKEMAEISLDAICGVDRDIPLDERPYRIFELFSHTMDVYQFFLYQEVYDNKRFELLSELTFVERLRFDFNSRRGATTSTLDALYREKQNFPKNVYSINFGKKLKGCVNDARNY